MQIKVSHKDGRAVTLDGAQYGWLLSGVKFKADQIETAMVTVTREGEEPIELTLPTGMVDMMLEGIGAGMTAPAAAPEGMEEEMVEQVESVDMDGEDREDGAQLDARTRAFIAQQVDSLYRQRRTAERNADSRDAEVRRHAATLKVDAKESRPWHAIALDAIAKASPELADSTKVLAAQAAKGDATATGRLLERLEIAATGKLPHGDMLEGTKIHHTQPKADNRAPWELGVKNAKEIK